MGVGSCFFFLLLLETVLYLSGTLYCNILGIDSTNLFFFFFFFFLLLLLPFKSMMAALDATTTTTGADTDTQGHVRKRNVQQGIQAGREKGEEIAEKTKQKVCLYE